METSVVTAQAWPEAAGLAQALRAPAQEKDEPSLQAKAAPGSGSARARATAYVSKEMTRCGVKFEHSFTVIM